MGSGEEFLTWIPSRWWDLPHERGQKEEIKQNVRKPELGDGLTRQWPLFGYTADQAHHATCPWWGGGGTVKLNPSQKIVFYKDSDQSLGFLVTDHLTKGEVRSIGSCDIMVRERQGEAVNETL